MARRRLVMVVGTLALLLLPGSALAGTGAPVNHLSWTTYSGGYELDFDVTGTLRVFYLNTPRPVTNPTVVQGGPATCQPAQPDGNPNQYECFFNGSGPAVGTHVASWWQGSGIDPNAQFQFFYSQNGQLPYSGPLTVPRFSAPPPTAPKRTDLSRFQLQLNSRDNRPTGFTGHFWHYTMEDLLPDVGYDEELDFPGGFRYVGGQMPKCSLPRLNRGDKCSNAIIGSATITAYPHNCNDGLTLGNATPTVANLTLFNFGKSEVYALRRVPGAVTGFEIGVKKNHLSIDLPDELISPTPGTCVPATDVRFTVPIRRDFVPKAVSGAAKKRKKVAIGPFVTGKCPKNRTWKFTDRIKFTNGARNPSTGKLARNTVATVTRSAQGTCRR